MNVLGLSCYYHDAAAAVIVSGRLAAAVQEERFSRKKNDAAFPENAIAYCLKESALSPSDIDAVAFYEKPLLKFDRQLRMARFRTPTESHRPIPMIDFQKNVGLRIRETIRDRVNFGGQVFFVHHHLSHAASSYLMSPFTDAAVLVADGVGEWVTTSQWSGSNGNLTNHREIVYPHSIGLFYATLTSFLGFKPNSDEYRVMGLASYGRPTKRREIERLVQSSSDGSFSLDMNYFAFDHDEVRMYSEALTDLLGPPRHPLGQITQEHMDIAASVQEVTEDLVVNLVLSLSEVTESKNLCLAGGVAHNCAANRRIVERSGFTKCFVQPAAGDSGAAIGAAAYVCRAGSLADGWSPLPAYNTFLGPRYTDGAIVNALESAGLCYTYVHEDNISEVAAKLIWQDRIVAWFQGRLEFGQRALGNRSILANPCNPAMPSKLNRNIKMREEFRPFAPSVTIERARDFFEMHIDSPFMMFTASVRDEARHLLPAVTHVDGSARLQTVASDQNPLFYSLLREFEKMSGVPVVINTSFNVKGEPIVCSPEDAAFTFLHSDIDDLVIGNYVASRPWEG